MRSVSTSGRGEERGEEEEEEEEEREEEEEEAGVFEFECRGGEDARRKEEIWEDASRAQDSRRKIRIAGFGLGWLVFCCKGL